MLKESYKKNIYIGIAIQFILCLILGIILKSDLLIIMMILDIGIIITYYIILNDVFLIIVTLICSFSLIFLEFNMRFPHCISYTEDFLILMMALKICIYYFKENIKINIIHMLMIMLIVVSLCSCILNGKSVMSVVKNFYYDYFRYFIVGNFILIASITKDQVIKFAKGLWYALLFQVPLIIFEYFYSSPYWTPDSKGSLKQDFLSGILGWKSTTEFGMFACISMTILFILYIKDKVKLRYLIICAATIIAGGIIAEIKFIFILIPIMFLLVCLTNINIKSISVLVLTFFMLIIGSIGVVNLYPKFSDFYNIETIEKYSDESYGVSGIGRTTSFKVAQEIININPFNTFFGYGPGSADNIRSSCRFSQFNVSKYIVEEGDLGTICIYSFYLYLIYISWQLLKYKEDEFEYIIGYVGIIFSCITIVATFLNDSMTKINFAVLSWMVTGIVCKYYCSHDRSINNKLLH